MNIADEYEQLRLEARDNSNSDESLKYLTGFQCQSPQDYDETGNFLPWDLLPVIARLMFRIRFREGKHNDS